MDFNAIIDAVLAREVDPEHPDAITNDPSDSGGRTKYGISERSNPDLWADGDVTLEEAREAYFKRYIYPFRMITDQGLLHQLVDWGVPSGTKTVIKILQQMVGVVADGEIGPLTLKAIENYPAGTLFGESLSGMALLRMKLRDARIMFHAATAKHRPKDLKFLLGWLRRAMEFV